MANIEDEFPKGIDLAPHFLRRVAKDYDEGRAKPNWEIPSIIAKCLYIIADKLEKKE